MGCNQSKAKEDPKNDDFTDLKEAGQPANSSERAPADQQAAAAHPLDADDGEVIRGEAPAARKRDKRFQNGGPLRECLVGADVTPCFKTGLLFRITQGDAWYFYNDSSDYEMTVSFTYGPMSAITPSSEATQLEPAAGSDWPTLALTIYPGETKKFMQGSFNGYKSKYNAVPLTAAYKERIVKETSDRLAHAINAVEQLGHFDTEEARLAKCVELGLPFVDLAFKPVAESLSKRDDTRQLAPTAWMRPTEYLPPEDHHDIRVFRDIEPNDIDQGQLGDCWFLCAVASLAEFESKIKDMFQHPQGPDAARRERSLGAYRVTFNKNGWWHVVIIDDLLPCVGGRPCFAKNADDVAELWPSLIEKAYAKLHGSYASITGGDALHALQDLTGYPTNRFDTEWEEAVNDKRDNGLAFFGDLLRYDQAGYLINLNTPGVDNSAYMGSHGASNTKEFEERYKAAGLGMGHAYSVISVKEFPSDGVHLVRIRNPWGNSTEWTGAWSDTSDKWQQYPHIAKACDHKVVNDGTFWMEWSDVKKYFDGGGTCFTKFDWFDYRVKGAWLSGTSNIILEVVVHEDVEAFLTLSQVDRRGQPRGSVDSKYAAIMLSVCRPDSGTNRVKVHQNSTSDADAPKESFTFLFSRDVGLKYRFSAAGDNAGRPYLIVPRIFDGSIAEKSFVLGIITDKPVAPGKMSVRFRTLPAGAAIYKNYTGFTYDPVGATVVSDREYQFNPEVGCPVTRVGSEIEVLA